MDDGVNIEVIGIASSTGGPNALSRILKDLPADFPAGILIVQHIVEGFDYGMASWLDGVSALTVRMAGRRDMIRPGEVLICPSGFHMETPARGRVQLLNTPARNGHKPSGDVLFESLAGTYGAGAAGVILTGMGEDGAAGLLKMRQSGAFTMVQGEESSVVFGMPRAAIELGAVARIVQLDDIARTLLDIFNRESSPLSEDVINRISSLLSQEFGFRLNSPVIRNSIADAVSERVRVLGARDAGDYLSLKFRDRATSELETKKIYNLISVNETSFFRIPEHFTLLEKVIIPGILENKKGERAPETAVWSAGCSTGEEPYSIAISWMKATALRPGCSLKLLGTDLDAEAILKAREGVYVKNSFRGVPQDMIARHWSDSHGGFSLDEKIKSLVEFRVHNLNEDTPGGPFSKKWDVIFCRNVLIYLRRDACMRLLERFHNCLNPGGYLLVGPSETMLCKSHQFESLLKENVFFFRKPREETRNQIMTQKSHAAVKQPPEGEAGAVKPMREPVRNPVSDSELRNIVRDCIDKERYDDAHSHIDSLIKNDGRTAERYYLKGMAFASAGETLRAKNEYDRALECDFMHVASETGLGILYIEEKNYDRAVYHLKRALYLDHDDIAAAYQLCRTYIQTGRKELARAQLKHLAPLFRRAGGLKYPELAGNVSLEELESVCADMLDGL